MATCLLEALIVDDDVFVREGLSLYLRNNGFTVFQADDTATAWEIFRTRHPSIVVVDLLLPMHPSQPDLIPAAGLDLIRQMKTAAPDVGVILLSAHDQYLEDFLALLRAGYQGLAYKLKGRRTKDLLETCRRVLDGQIEIDPGLRPQGSAALVDALKKGLSDAERPWVDLVLQRFDELSPQEFRAAHLIAASLNAEGIARRLQLQRADTLITRVYSRLGLDALTESSRDLRPALLLTKACQIFDLCTHTV